MFTKPRKAAKNASVAPTAANAAEAVAVAVKLKQNKKQNALQKNLQGKFYLSLKTLPSKSIRPSFFILVSSFVIAVRSTER